MILQRTKFFLLCVFITNLGRTHTLKIISRNGLTFQQDDDVLGIYRLVNITTSVLEKGSISDIEDMEVLIIKNKTLTEIHPGVFQNVPKLVSLSIEETKLTEIKSGVFNPLYKLAELTLLHCEISSIDSDAFHNMTNLAYINLSGNKLKVFDIHWFELTPSLYSIQISNNLITDLPAKAFANLKSEGLLQFFLHGNKFTDINENSFHGLKYVTTISLDNCGFETFDGQFLEGLILDNLYIRENKLQCIDKENYSQVFVANTTYVKDNPWDLECLKKIQAWANENGKEINLTF